MWDLLLSTRVLSRKFHPGMIEALWPRVTDVSGLGDATNECIATLDFRQFVCFILRVANFKFTETTRSGKLSTRVNLLMKQHVSKARRRQSSTLVRDSRKQFQIDCLDAEVRLVFQENQRYLFSVFLAFSGIRDTSFATDVDMGFDGFSSLVQTLPDTIRDVVSRHDVELLIANSRLGVVKSKRKRNLTVKTMRMSFAEFLNALAGLACIVVGPYNATISEKVQVFIDDGLKVSSGVQSRISRPNVRAFIELGLGKWREEMQELRNTVV